MLFSFTEDSDFIKITSIVECFLNEFKSDRNLSHVRWSPAVRSVEF